MLTIRVFDTTGASVGSGPVWRVETADFTQTLDEVGKFTINVSASDPTAVALLQPDYQIDLYDDWALVFQGIIRNRRRTPWGSYTLTGYGLMDQLRVVTVGRIWNFDNVTPQSAATDLAALASWTAIVDAATTNLVAKFGGVSALKALLEIAKRFGWHVRLGSASQTLEIGAFGDDSAVTITNPPVINRAIETNENVALVDSLELLETSDTLYNDILVLGGGREQAQLTLQTSTRTTPYAIKSRVNHNGDTEYYLEDAASIAAHGRRQGAFISEDINPLSNSDTDIINAANALYDKSVAFLQQNKDPQVSYTLTVRNLTADVRPGNTVRLIYQGVVTQRGEVIDDLDLDETLYIIAVQTRFERSGQKTQALEISNVQKLRQSDTDVILNEFENLQVLRAIPQPSVVTWNYIYYDSMHGTDPITNPNGYKPARFRIPISNSITYVTKVTIRFVTSPLWTPAVYFDLTPPEYNWALTVSDNYPSDLDLSIDGVDVTSQLGGPWNPGINSPLDIELDVTNLILNAAGGLRGDHPVVFGSSLERTEQVEVPPNTPRSNGGGNTGMVEMTISVQGVSQAIAVS